MKTKYYIARWALAGHPSIANVSFYSISDYHAKLKADKIGRELGVSRTPRTIYCDNRMVEEVFHD